MCSTLTSRHPIHYTSLKQITHKDLPSAVWILPIVWHFLVFVMDRSGLLTMVRVHLVGHSLGTASYKARFLVQLLRTFWMCCPITVMFLCKNSIHNSYQLLRSHLNFCLLIRAGRSSVRWRKNKPITGV